VPLHEAGDAPAPKDHAVVAGGFRSGLKPSHAFTVTVSPRFAGTPPEHAPPAPMHGSTPFTRTWIDGGKGVTTTRHAVGSDTPETPGVHVVTRGEEHEPVVV
jgi:hypothetical protein